MNHRHFRTCFDPFVFFVINDVFEEDFPHLEKRGRRQQAACEQVRMWAGRRQKVRWARMADDNNLCLHKRVQREHGKCAQHV